MLDTNICIHAIKGRPPALAQRFGELADELCISTITLGELFFGAENSKRRAQNFNVVEQFASRLAIVEFGATAAAHYGQIRAALRRAGTTVGVHDMQIGAHARSDGLTLVTNNMREFRRIPGLQLDNWVE